MKQHHRDECVRILKKLLKLMRESPDMDCDFRHDEDSGISYKSEELDDEIELMIGQPDPNHRGMVLVAAFVPVPEDDNAW